MALVQDRVGAAVAGPANGRVAVRTIASAGRARRILRSLGAADRDSGPSRGGHPDRRQRGADRLAPARPGRDRRRTDPPRGGHQGPDARVDQHPQTPRAGLPRRWTGRVLGGPRRRVVDRRDHPHGHDRRRRRAGAGGDRDSDRRLRHARKPGRQGRHRGGLPLPRHHPAIRRRTPCRERTRRGARANLPGAERSRRCGVSNGA